MSPSPNIQSPMRQASNSAAMNGFGPSEVNTWRLDLRDSLAATVVRELSFAEFRAALEKFGKRLS